MRKAQLYTKVIEAGNEDGTLYNEALEEVEKTHSETLINFDLAVARVEFETKVSKASAKGHTALVQKAQKAHAKALEIVQEAANDAVANARAAKILAEKTRLKSEKTRLHIHASHSKAAIHLNAAWPAEVGDPRTIDLGDAHETAKEAQQQAWDAAAMWWVSAAHAKAEKSETVAMYAEELRTRKVIEEKKRAQDLTERLGRFRALEEAARKAAEREETQAHTEAKRIANEEEAIAASESAHIRAEAARAEAEAKAAAANLEWSVPSMATLVLADGITEVEGFLRGSSHHLINIADNFIFRNQGLSR